MKKLFKGMAQKTVEGKIRQGVEEELGNKSLAYMSRIARGLLRIHSVDVVRKQVIKGIEGDLKRGLTKNCKATIDELISDALKTPDYMKLLKELGMDETHLRLLAQEAKTRIEGVVYEQK
tara:strand:- start:1371 stop:1730 length:360 start_codon:yes stop_codon:yes gene_type:complete